MTNSQIFYNILGSASLICHKRKQLLCETGESFNIFNVLDLEYHETRLHSKFIAELLNPQGSHGQKTVFLKRFLEQLNIFQIEESLLAQAKVYVEEYIGPISEDCMKG